MTIIGTENTKANQEALELLNQIRPYIKYFDSSQYIDDLANGEICLAVGWSGDVFIAAYEEIEEVWYSIPNEGTVIWFDMMGIPADAKNVDNAHKFIDYVLRLITAGLTFKYSKYPSEIPIKTINIGIWISSIISILISLIYIF